LPGTKSPISAVPGAVPLVRHNSLPVPGPVAANQSSLPTGAKAAGWLERAPGWISSSWVVPAAVPSLDHSSRPLAGEVPANTTLPP
jgi:hypothetical protein